MNNHLPHYFQDFAPTLSKGFNQYLLRNPRRQIPKIRHQFHRHSLRYKLLKNFNNTPETITEMAIS